MAGAGKASKRQQNVLFWGHITLLGLISPGHEAHPAIYISISWDALSEKQSNKGMPQGLKGAVHCVKIATGPARDSHASSTAAKKTSKIGMVTMRDCWSVGGVGKLRA